MRHPYKPQPKASAPLSDRRRISKIYSSLGNSRRVARAVSVPVASPAPAEEPTPESEDEETEETAADQEEEREVNFYGGGDSYTYKKTVGKDAIPTPDEVAHMKIGDIRMHVYDGGHQFWVLTTVPASDPPRLAWTAAQQGMAHPTRGRGYCLVLKQDKKPAWLKSDTAKTYKQRTAREAKKNASPKGPADAGGGNPPGGMGSGGNERRAKKRV